MSPPEQFHLHHLGTLTTATTVGVRPQSTPSTTINHHHRGCTPINPINHHHHGCTPTINPINHHYRGCTPINPLQITFERIKFKTPSNGSVWTCDTCNEQISADPAVVNAHNASHEHARMARMAHTEQHRVDGQVLAAEQREKNGAAKNARKKRS